MPPRPTSQPPTPSVIRPVPTYRTIRATTRGKGKTNLWRAGEDEDWSRVRGGDERSVHMAPTKPITFLFPFFISIYHHFSVSASEEWWQAWRTWRCVYSRGVGGRSRWWSDGVHAGRTRRGCVRYRFASDNGPGPGELDGETDSGIMVPVPAQPAATKQAATLVNNEKASSASQSTFPLLCVKARRQSSQIQGYIPFTATLPKLKNSKQDLKPQKTPTPAHVHSPIDMSRCQSTVT